MHLTLAAAAAKLHLAAGTLLKSSAKKAAFRASGGKAAPGSFPRTPSSPTPPLKSGRKSRTSSRCFSCRRT